jgi:4-hydroxy-tetrahydrodipicolinate reductase
VVAKFSRDGIDRDKLEKADVAIEFTRPEVAFENLKTCFELQIPVITGTTGWLDDYDEAVNLCKKHQSAFLYASNFSLGVNIFFEINKKLASLMRQQTGYSVSMEEIHHTQKLDAPSGTAITLAEQIINQIEEKNAWTLNGPSEEEIQINAKRIEGVPGTHSIQYQSNIDTIEIKHTAHNRQGFALGAVVAAEFIHNQRGVFTMKDVLKLQS